MDNKRIRVFQYFWGKLDTGGAETFIVNMFEQLNRDLFQVDFCSYEEKEYFYSRRILQDGGGIIPLQKRESKVLIIRLIERWINLYKVIKNGKYDIFHCNCDFSFKCIEMFIAKLAGVKVRICHSHNSAIDTNNLKGRIQYKIHCMMRPILRKYSTSLMACSVESAKWLYGENIDLNKVLLVNNGIDSSYFDFDRETREKIRNELNFGDSHIIGNVGRFSKIKNQKFIIEIINYCHQNNLDVKACLIGDGVELESVKDEVERLGLSQNVVFIGLTDKVRDYMMAFDSYVMPSLYEGLPVSGIEAQATGLHCVVSSTVDKALDLTGNVSFIDLDKGVKKWVDTILSIKSSERETMVNKICSMGYDIKATADLISNLYIKSIRN